MPTETETPDDHVHDWTGRQDCRCGAPPPTWLVAAWERFFQKTGDDSVSRGD